MTKKLPLMAMVGLIAWVGCGSPTTSDGPSHTGGSLKNSGGSTAIGGSGGAGGPNTGGISVTGGKIPDTTGGVGGNLPLATGGLTVLQGGSLATGGADAGVQVDTGSPRDTSMDIAISGGRTADAANPSGGQPGTGGVISVGGTTSQTNGPCDIYEAATTPCVAAHSTVRALYAAYSGSLYQVRRASDKTTKDVPVLAAGGFVNLAVQDQFCTGTTCTISILYDQSPNKNDLTKSGVAHWLPNGGIEANAAQGQATVGGHNVHGIFVTSGSNVAYRNNATKGVAKGNQAESMYMVVDGKRYSNQCCFDYGNAETTGNDDGNGTMEAVYFGNDITWGGKGDGNGPWVAADLENGVFKCDKGGWQSQSISVPNAKSITANFVTVVLKGPAANTFAIKGGSAQSGTLTTMWNGARPSGSYYPKKLQGAIILGTGGDGSNTGTGTFFEGVMTSGNPPDSVDDAVQANIVAAGYGR